MKVNPTKTVNELVSVLPYVIDTDQSRKIYHAWRVAIIAARCAQKAARRPIDCQYIFYAALLHDIGGVGFPIHIIHYLSRNDKTSRSILLSHPIIGAQIVSSIPKMNPAGKLILDHHEWINGQGFPRAKTGAQIPWGAQAIRIADSIDIYLQSGRIKTLKELKKKMTPYIQKEYYREFFSLAMDILSRKGFFAKILSRKSVPEIFKQVQQEIGLIQVPPKIDAVGKTLEAMAEIIDMKHPFTSGHSMRVSRYAMAIAMAMGLGHDEVTQIRWAGLLHDIGKLVILRRLLDKPTALTDEEYHEIQKHAQYTHDIMNMMPSLADLLPIASAHHEQFDGSGYPRGLKGEQIPLGARILGVCDAFDAMTSNRPYRQPLTFEQACEEVKKFSGRQFDPEIVKHALPLLLTLGF